MASSYEARSSDPVPNDPNAKKKIRLAHLDAFRILGVSGVIWAHNGDNYLTSNVVYGQNWGLQVLMVITGISWSMSTKGVGQYGLRLLVFVLLGYTMNLCGWYMVPNTDNESVAITVGTGKPNFFNAMYQMWFAVAVFICVLVSAPLKMALSSSQRTCWAIGLIYVVAAAVQWSTWKSGLWGAWIEKALNNSGGTYYAKYSSITGDYLAQLWWSLAIIAVMYAISLTTKVKKINEFIGWILAFHIWVPAVLYTENLGEWTHCVQLFVLAIVVQRFSIFGQRTLAHFITSYWPVMIWLVGIFSIPEAPDRRMDVFPPHSLINRFRFYGLETIFVMMFIVCGTPADPLDRVAPVEMVKDEHNILSWLNRWALLAYMSHVLFLRVIPYPYGIVICYGTAVAFWAEETLHKMTGRQEPLGEIGFAWLVLLIPLLSWVSLPLAFSTMFVAVILVAYFFWKQHSKNASAGATPLLKTNGSETYGEIVSP
jgi:hypothetical protein